MSLYVLDTDITTLYRCGHEAVMRHALTHPPEELAITVITVEEQLSGWYALLRQVKASADLTRVYDRLVETVMFFSSTRILSFTQASRCSIRAVEVYAAPHRHHGSAHCCYHSRLWRYPRHA